MSKKIFPFQALLLLLAITPFLAGPPVQGAALSLVLSPPEMAIFQRNESSHSQSVRVSVKRASPFVASAELTVHAAQDYVSRVAVSSQEFSIGSPLVPQGGWYQAEVVQLDSSGARVAVSRWEKIGVGDVYIVAGQSNAANWAQEKTTSHSGLTAMLDPITGSWQPLRDPQPFADIGEGSYWPEFADLLAQHEGVPVGIVNTAIGGTRIEQWQPGKFSDSNEPLFERLVLAAKSLRSLGGFRMILWHQGEGNLGTDSTYRSQFLSLASNLDRAIGANAKWMVATATFSPPDLAATECGSPAQPPAGAALRAAQRSLPDGLRIFAGPDSDDLAGAGYRYPGPLGMCIHFTAPAQHLMAARWAAAVSSATAPRKLSLGNRIRAD